MKLKGWIGLVLLCGGALWLGWTMNGSWPDLLNWIEKHPASIAVIGTLLGGLVGFWGSNLIAQKQIKKQDLIHDWESIRAISHSANYLSAIVVKVSDGSLPDNDERLEYVKHWNIFYDGLSGLRCFTFPDLEKLANEIFVPVSFILTTGAYCEPKESPKVLIPQLVWSLHNASKHISSVCFSGRATACVSNNPEPEVIQGK